MPEQASNAIVVLPSLCALRSDVQLRRWLARGAVSVEATPMTDLERVLSALSLTKPASGYAALRYHGHRGEPPTDWIAAADPAFLEARLDHVHLHAIDPATVTGNDLQALFRDLQATLCAAGPAALVCRDGYGYLSGGPPLATAHAAPQAIDGQRIDDFLPSGPDAGGYLALTGEIELSLHEHPLNADRSARGLRPINTLWIWGGGRAPLPKRRNLPELFCNEPLLRGYWRSRGNDVNDWPGGIDSCSEQAAGAFVASVPEQTGGTALCDLLANLRQLQRRGALTRITLLARDGVIVAVRRSDRLRIWRRNACRLSGRPT